MKQTIKFLDVIDIERKKSRTFSQAKTAKKMSLVKQMTESFKDSKDSTQKFRSLLPINVKNHNYTQSKFFQQNINHPTSHNHHQNSNRNSNKHNKFPFFRALHFNQNKFQQYPDWLTEREDFATFMYKNYQSKLLAIPKICQKQPQDRASDQKYFVSLYLQQLQIFQNLPQIIMDNLLAEIKTKKYQAGDIIHDQYNEVKFMAIIFIGSVEYIKSKKVYRKERNQIIMSQAFYKTNHPTITAKQNTVLLCIGKGLYKKLQKQLKQQMYDKHRAQVSDMMKSDFFVELHIKEKRAKQFYDDLTPEFYFKNEQICEAGQQAEKFYFHFKGQIIQKNHIYIRQHNKWPLPNKRWEVRAVYNSFQNETVLHPFSFFGDQEIIGQYKFKSSYYAKTFCKLYSMPAQLFKKSLTVEDFKRLKKYRNEHVSINYTDFEQRVRSKLRENIENKKIIHKAIDTSFSNKKVESMSFKKKALLQNFQKTMLQNSKVQDYQESQPLLN